MEVSKLPSFHLYHLEDEGVSEEWFKDHEIPQIIKGPPRRQGREKGSDIEFLFFLPNNNVNQQRYILLLPLFHKGKDYQ